MYPRLVFFVSAVALFVWPKQMVADSDSAAGSRHIENLRAFTRVYGYVRFFHPSAEASKVNWDSVGVLGAELCRDARDLPELRMALLAVFQPIAPDMRLTLTSKIFSNEALSPTDYAGGMSATRTFWQYQGINLSDQKGPYGQKRVIVGNDGVIGPSLFQPAIPPAPISKTVIPGMVLSLPLALPVIDSRAKLDESSAFERLQTQLGSIDPKSLTAEDWRVRITDVAVVWNVFQHFHPYLDSAGIEWTGALEPALTRALADTTIEEFHATLSELIAKTNDGHGYVYGRPPGAGGIPIRVAVVEGRLIVTGVREDAPFRKGDILERVDGVDALDVLSARERYVSGSPHLRRFRALNQFGEGSVGSVATVGVSRDGASVTVDYVRTPDRRGYFFNSVGEFEFPALAEVRPGIFYINLKAIKRSELQEALPRLAQAKGVIFDQRWDGRKTVGDEKEQVRISADVIPHLTGESVHASPMLVPQITQPDRVGWTYRESTWPVAPREPRIRGRVVFINEPSVVSYGETCMAMIANYRLATLVGDSTAGCNGNVSFIPLLGGFRVMWTGMDVRKHDRTSFYMTGFTPDHPVSRTISAVKNGVDEYLEKAIEVIEPSTPVSPSVEL